MGCDDDSDLAFFPAMRRPAEPKVELTAWMIGQMSRYYDVRPMKDHARDVSGRLGKDTVVLSKSSSQAEAVSLEV